ncbi:MAG: Maf family nucleotide pyrophosphatase [Muribaculaceae bacterium]|nr:Maf family nucleotide pyrophosphatase [Muribaculaceae bacterium]
MEKILKNYKVLLASRSPRRRELLGMLDIPFECVRVEGVDETFPPEMNAVDVPGYLARKKASACRDLIKDDELVITADTVVILDNTIYGKPYNEEQAVDMLMTLQGRTHQVVTGVSVTTKEKSIDFSVSTDVTFGTLTREEAEYYVKRYHPLDKAGAYGIQEWIGCVAVERIDGSFYNVMGLPVQRLYKELKKF